MRVYLADAIGLADEPPPDKEAKRDAVMEEGLETLSDFADSMIVASRFFVHP